MDTLLQLTREELSEVQQLTQENDPLSALQHAVREYIRYAKRMRLKELANQVEMQDNWKSLEDAEMDSQNGRLQSGAD